MQTTQTIGVNSGEKKTIDLCLNQHSDSEVYATKIQVLVDSKKNKYSEARLLLVGKHRVYVFKSGKPSHELFFLDIFEISSPSTTSLVIKAKNGTVQMEGTLEQIDEVISKIYFSFASTFPAVKDQLTILTIPEDRAPKIKTKVDSQLHFDDNCGSYAITYTAICDQLNIDPLEDIVWGINHLYVANEVTDFKLFECSLRPERIKSEDARALLTALVYNTYFTGLFIDHVKLDSHAISAISNILQNNKVLKQFYIRESSLKSEAFFTFASAFEKNPSLKLTHIDWSDNNVDDKTILTLAANLPAFVHGLAYLNLSGCGISSRSSIVLIKGLESHDMTCQNLTTLNLSGNKIDAEGCKALSALFAKTPNLIDLSLASTPVDYRLLGKLETLQHLDISGNKIVTKDARHVDLLNFLKQAPNLTKMDLSGCSFPPEIFAAFFEATPKLKTLNLSNNSLGDAGLIALAEFLPTMPNSITTLILDRNFAEKSNKLRPKAIQAFSDYLASDKCKLTSLSIRGSAKGGALKADLLPIAFSLLSNQTLKKVDFRANLSGNGLALAVNKFLQINDVLEELYVDGNDITVFGFQLLRAGLARNFTVRALPLPIDTSPLMKEHGKITLEILTDIQAMLLTNSKNQSGGSRERAFSMVLNDNGKQAVAALPTIPQISATESGQTIALRERSKTTVDKPAIISSPKSPSATVSGKKKKHKKDKAIDAKHASALFTSLNEAVASPADLTAESLELVQKMASPKEPEKKKAEEKQNDNAAKKEEQKK